MPGEDANFTKVLTGNLEGTDHSESASINRIGVQSLILKERGASATGCGQNPGAEYWKGGNECWQVSQKNGSCMIKS